MISPYDRYRKQSVHCFLECLICVSTIVSSYIPLKLMGYKYVKAEPETTKIIERDVS